MNQPEETKHSQARDRFCQIFQGLSLCDLAKALPIQVVRDLNMAYGAKLTRMKDFCLPCERERSLEFYDVSRRTYERAEKNYGPLIENHINRNNLV